MITEELELSEFVYCLIRFFSVQPLPTTSLTYTLWKTTPQHVHKYSPLPFQLPSPSPSKSWQHPLADHFLCHPPIFFLSTTILRILTAHSEGWTLNGQQRFLSAIRLHWGAKNLQDSASVHSVRSIANTPTTVVNKQLDKQKLSCHTNKRFFILAL